MLEHILKPIAGVNKSVSEKLALLNIHTYWDILLHVPIRYEDLTKTSSIEESAIGSKSLVEGEIISAEVVQGRTRQLRVVLSDKTAYINLIFLHFYPNYKTQYQIGKTIQAYGEIKGGMHGIKTIFHPKVKTVTENLALPATFTPIYSTTDGLKQAQIVKIVNHALDYLEKTAEFEILPKEIILQNNLPNFFKSIKLLHQLSSEEFKNKQHIQALARLKFDEFLVQQLILLNIYQNKHKAPAPVLKPRATYTKQLFEFLPFQLTNAQRRVLGEIYADIAKPSQMNRLLQGDVGSGKTIVAAFTMLVAVENGFQAAIVAPTEILAEQHYLKIKDLLKPFMKQNIRADTSSCEDGTKFLNVVWLAGSMSAKEKKATYAKIENAEANIIIGTHAVFQKKVVFDKLALIVIDEQHRFGVEQRLKLQEKGNNPHQLMMSATPIPRSLAMSYYADLDVSTIDELPPGRTPIETLLVSNNRRDEVIEFVKKHLEQNAQVYWVCPLIEESEKLDLESAYNTFEDLSRIFLGFKLGLIHGKLKSSEKAEIMDKFKNGEIRLLVATTVIEVGVDVPNASIMVIEHSERMGLSQLHQLRGRVGRGTNASKCILLYHNNLTENSKRRLKIMRESTDGFAIAHEDLLIRGPGEILGSRQSGLPELRFANLETDMAILNKAKNSAAIMLEKYRNESKQMVNLWFHQDLDFLKT